MLEKFIIFSRTGVVLFSMCWSAVKGDPLAALVKDALLTQHIPRGVSAFEYGDYAVKWTEAVTQELVFAAVLDKAVSAQVRYTDTLLASVKDVFLQKFGLQLDELPPVGRTADGTSDVFGFLPLFERLHEAAEQSASTGIKALNKRSGSAKDGPGDEPEPSRAGAGAAPDDAPASPPPAALTADHAEDSSDLDDADIAAARAALSSRSIKGLRTSTGTGSRKGVASKPGSKDSPAIGSAGKAKPVKGLSAMPLSDFKYTKDAERSLDRSGSTGGSAGAGAAAAVDRVEFKFDGSTGRDLDDSDEELIAAATAAASAGAGAGAATAAAASKGGVSSVASWFSRSSVGTFLSSLTGNKVLDRLDLEPVMESLKGQLIGKNVAREAAEALCDSVVSSLEGRKLEVAGSVAGVVVAALRDSIERILTPRRPVDLLAEVRAKKASRGGPYVIVFVGVNGVGKSTSLSKVAYHLKDNKHSVRIVACDSFRSGAVEQLKRHCTALDIQLCDRGYGGDPVTIATAGIREAAAAGDDVVLVDTAGRMQNNAGLMQQLAKLVAVNKPDLVLFVGEALVGNDGVDQLSEFNKKLVEYAADKTHPRGIDGIVMTKFDTIDDKVGAALSMVYTTGVPVIFLGTGQKYTDLRKLNVGAVVKSLMA